MMNTRQATWIVATLLLLTTSLRAADQPPQSEPIPLWPGVAPGEKGDIGEETNKTPNDPVTRLTNVTRPTITVFRPPADNATGTAVLVCPGGAYNILAMNKEGTDICRWLNSIGVTGVLLKYRVPRRAGLEKHVAPLQDAQRAMGLVRQRAKEFGINPSRLGVIGFSAGGHLGAMLSTSFDERTYPAVDDADKQSCRPDFSILMYPFYMTTEEHVVTLAPEFKVTERTPPTFIVMTQDDRVEYAFGYALALKKAKVPAELHVYATAGHGFGLGRDKGAVSAWPKRAEEWLRANGWL
jgi:acetyl esterase/lipase